MRFKDEKQMWYADTEMLAARLANKDKLDVQEILDSADVITLRSTERPKAKLINRISLVVLYPALVVVSVVKWLLTGDRFFDSWAKKSRWFSAVLDFAGIK